MVPLCETSDGFELVPPSARESSVVERPPVRCIAVGASAGLLLGGCLWALLGRQFGGLQREDEVSDRVIGLSGAGWEQWTWPDGKHFMLAKAGGSDQSGGGQGTPSNTPPPTQIWMWPDAKHFMMWTPPWIKPEAIHSLTPKLKPIDHRLDVIEDTLLGDTAWQGRRLSSSVLWGGDPTCKADGINSCTHTCSFRITLMYRLVDDDIDKVCTLKTGQLSANSSAKAICLQNPQVTMDGPMTNLFKSFALKQLDAAKMLHKRLDISHMYYYYKVPFTKSPMLFFAITFPHFQAFKDKIGNMEEHCNDVTLGPHGDSPCMIMRAFQEGTDPKCPALLRCFGKDSNVALSWASTAKKLETIGDLFPLQVTGQASWVQEANGTSFSFWTDLYPEELVHGSMGFMVSAELGINLPSYVDGNPTFAGADWQVTVVSNSLPECSDYVTVLAKIEEVARTKTD